MIEMKNTNYRIVFFSLLLSFLATGCIKKDINTAEGIPNPHVSLYVLRNVFKGNELTINRDILGGAYNTSGVVVSNHENKNLPPNTIALQSVWRGQSRGMLIRVPEAGSYSFGDSLHINVEQARLVMDKGMLVLDGLTKDKITKVAEGVRKGYMPVSIQNLLKNAGAYEGQLVSITADVDPDPAPGTTFSGKKYLKDSEGNQMQLFTEEGAVFAGSKIAPSATFQGVLVGSDNGPQLRLQKLEDMTFPSGKIYQGWPETFEKPYRGKLSYNISETKNLLQMSTGEWWLYQVIQGETAGGDRIVSGKQALRFQQNRSDNAYAQMNFDMPDGASKVTFWYGAYSTDRSCTFQLEYSVNKGASWERIGSPISNVPTVVESPTPKQAIYLMNINQPVRFRINKLGLGTSSNTISNGRLGIDDFAIYQSY